MIKTSFNETYRIEYLENGLKVILWRKPGFKSSAFYLSTPYGSLDYKQVNEDGELIEFPLGIAHFLEHKMFESENLDIMSFYSSFGSDVNAFTSFDQTAYYFTSTNTDIEPELNELLNFVNELSIDDKSVEKEKGIINQELEMYLQNPDSRLYFESFKSLFKEYPLKFDIGGDENTVSQITTEMLYRCHRLNYHPSRMTLICVSGFDDDYLLNIIKKNQDNKTFSKPIKLERFDYQEDDGLAIPYNLVKMDVQIPKVAVAYKILTKDMSTIDRYILEMSLRFLLEARFSTINPNYQNWLDEKIINSYFNYDIDLSNGYGYLYFQGESDPDIFVDFITTQVDKMLKEYPDSKTIELLKNKRYGNLLEQFDDVNSLAGLYLSFQLCNLELFEALETSFKMNLDIIKDRLKDFKLSKPSVTILKK